MADRGAILLTGGTGKVSSRLVPLLSSNGNSTLVASRSGTCPSLPHCQGVKFDWLDSSTYSFLESTLIHTILIISPPIMDPFPSTKAFIDLAISMGVKRLVLISGSLLEVGDGPMMAKVSKYITSLSVEYAILRPSWFMDNFSETQHLTTICDESKFITASGNGKVPFIACDDVAAVAFRALTDETPLNTDILLLGPELLSYDDVAAILTTVLHREITHVHISEDLLALTMTSWGIPPDYASVLARLDTAVKNGEEERMNSIVYEITGNEPMRFEQWIEEEARKGIWSRKQASGALK